MQFGSRHLLEAVGLCTGFVLGLRFLAIGHCLNRILGGSCVLYAAKNVMLFWRLVSGGSFPYVVTS